MEPKPFWASITFWGAVLAVAAPIAGQYGVTLDQAGWANDVASAIGGVLVLYGRARATAPLKLM